MNAATTSERLASILRPYQAARVDGSTRGSGLNAVWKIRIGSDWAILKTYATRRGPLQTLLTECGHRFSGRTSYRSAARQRTEEENLRQWRASGFDVPAIHACALVPPPPLPWLCLEYVEGRTLLEELADPSVPVRVRQDLLARFLPLWATRHRIAELRTDRRLIQEHATFAHVLAGAGRFVTIDLEVAFARGDISALLAREIMGCWVSLFRRMGDAASVFLAQFAIEYPDRGRLHSVVREVLHSPHPCRRWWHGLTAHRARQQGQVFHRTEIARRLESLLPS